MVDGMRLELVRYCYGPREVLGLLKFPVEDDGQFQYQLWTVECPWRANTRYLSCIPDGIYELAPFDSVRHPETYQVLNVPDRSGILIHAGNSVADVTGCIAPGITQEANKVWESRDALRILVDVLRRSETHSLVIGPGLGATLLRHVVATS